MVWTEQMSASPEAIINMSFEYLISSCSVWESNCMPASVVVSIHFFGKAFYTFGRLAVCCILPSGAASWWSFITKSFKGELHQFYIYIFILVQ